MHIDATRLRNKGWSQKEIDHATGVFQRAEENKHPHVRAGEHIGLWTLVLVLILGSMGIAVFLLPVFLFLTPMVAVPMSLLLGGCAGFLLAFTLRSLRIERKHHMTAAIVLFVAAFFAMLVTIQALAARFTFSVFPHQNALIVVVPYLTGMMVPYILDRRLHGSA